MKQFSFKSIFRLFLISLLLVYTNNSFSQRVGLVLSGGGVRGMAHIGVIKALEENNIPIDYIAGTSAGALVGSMYVTGKTPAEMEELILSKRFRDWATGVIDEEYSFYFPKKGDDASWVNIKFAYDSIIKTKLPGSLTNSAAVDFSLMEGLTPSAAKANYNFDSLMVPYRCVSADITNRRQVIFRNGDLAQAVRASMAFPLYFSPLTIDKRILFDGGIYNNFPVDVMMQDFNPDITIGVNAGGLPEVPVEDNVLSQIKSIVVTARDYSMCSVNDILIAPDINDFGVFEFDKAKAAIDSGYVATMRNMVAIKAAIARRVFPTEMKNKRSSFLSAQPSLYIDNITVKGITPTQANYVKRILNPTNDCISIEDLKKSFFKLVTDDNVRYAFPSLIYNRETNYYDLVMNIKQEKDLRVDFGGNFSSRPINGAFIGLQYNVWGNQSLRLMANSYFGKLYSSAQAKMRLDFPNRFRFFVEPEFTLNQYDYFKSNSTFFEDVKPSYLVLYDSYAGLNVGVPVRNKGKLTATGGYVTLKNSYYQSHEFSQADTTDRTTFDGFTTGINLERNTRDRKQYASKGNFFNLRAKFVSGIEKTIPGSTSLNRDTVSKNMRWLQMRLIYDNYFYNAGPLTFGYYADMYLSGQPFFANYTATILSATQFNPMPLTPTLFLPNFRAHNYIGGGLKSILKIKGNLEFRGELYIFQPLQEIVESSTGHAEYTSALSNRYFTGTAATVFHSPIGPVSISINYFQHREEPWAFLFHFGYILFNKSALE